MLRWEASGGRFGGRVRRGHEFNDDVGGVVVRGRRPHVPEQQGQLTRLTIAGVARRGACLRAVAALVTNMLGGSSLGAYASSK